MKGNRGLLIAVVALILLGAGWWLFTQRKSAPGVDLIAGLPGATKKPDSGTFEVDRRGSQGRDTAAPFMPRRPPGLSGRSRFPMTVAQSGRRDEAGVVDG